jgi:hypothetical protein
MQTLSVWSGPQPRDDDFEQLDNLWEVEKDSVPTKSWKIPHYVMLIISELSLVSSAKYHCLVGSAGRRRT